MQFKLVHNNINVSNLEESLAFYKNALGLSEVKRSEHPNFTILFLSDGHSDHLLELTWLKDHPHPYDLGENELHIAFIVDDYDSAHAKHKQMDCICYENTDMGLYFISDPDGYWIEIIPNRD